MDSRTTRMTELTACVRRQARRYALSLSLVAAATCATQQTAFAQGCASGGGGGGGAAGAVAGTRMGGMGPSRFSPGFSNGSISPEAAQFMAMMRGAQRSNRFQRGPQDGRTPRFAPRRDFGEGEANQLAGRGNRNRNRTNRLSNSSTTLEDDLTESERRSARREQRLARIQERRAAHLRRSAARREAQRQQAETEALIARADDAN